jgi:hypothetical protein
LFFGEILKDPGNYYFATGGDGFKAYYGAIYHVKYDTTALRSNAMNYPFGEAVSFTDSQPLITNPVRFISRNIADISDSTVALINLGMLFSILFSAVLLYLILCELKTAWWFAAIAAVGIAMLSPQLGRMAGHFSLSWGVWIPLVIFLIIKFNKTRWLVYSFLLGLTTFCAALMQFYFVAIIAFLIGGYWIYRFIWYRRESTFWYRDLLHLFLQFILPVLIVQFFTLFHEEVTDRTAWPYGLFEYLAHPVGVFLPDKSPWLFIPRNITVFRHISWESLAYIGTPALLGTIAGIVLLARNAWRKKLCTAITPVHTFNALFWVSVIALLFSFGLPMIAGLKGLADHLGPLRQLRALARFSWLFFYLANLLLFATLYRKAFSENARWWWKALVAGALVLLFTDGFYNVRNVAPQLKNRMPEMEAFTNRQINETWAGEIEATRYQAIIPIPYFHVGSENIWIDATHRVKETTMLASLKTGLPTTGVELSRTSIAQTYTNYSLFTEPLERLEFPDFLPDERPFILLVMNEYSPSEQEMRLINRSELITETEDFTLYELPVSVLRRLNLIFRDEVASGYQQLELSNTGTHETTRPGAYFIWQTFDDTPAEETFAGDGALSFAPREWKTVWHDTLHQVEAETALLISFWVKNYRQDGWLRTNIEFYLKNPENDETTFYMYSDFFKHIKAFSGDWALIEFSFETRNRNEIAKFSVRNNVLPRANYALDELLIREQGADVYRRDDRWLWFNNRRVLVR